MTQQKHTSLPWSVSRGNAHIIVTDKGNFNETIIAEAREDLDAEFIVKACNSYYTTRRDTLLEVENMLQNMLTITQEYGNYEHEYILRLVLKNLNKMAEEGR